MQRQSHTHTHAQCTHATICHALRTALSVSLSLSDRHFSCGVKMFFPKLADEDQFIDTDDVVICFHASELPPSRFVGCPQSPQGEHTIVWIAKDLHPCQFPKLETRTMPSTMSLVRRRHSDMTSGMPNPHFGLDLRPLEDMSTPRMEARGVAKHVSSLERFLLLVFPASVILFSLFFTSTLGQNIISHCHFSFSTSHAAVLKMWFCPPMHCCGHTLQTSQEISRHLHLFCFFASLHIFLPGSLPLPLCVTDGCLAVTALDLPWDDGMHRIRKPL